MATAPPQASGADLLAEAIITQAREEAEKIRQAAKAEADRLIAEARKEASARQEVAAQREKVRTFKDRAMGLAAARMQAHQLFLQGREEIIERAFGCAAQALAALRREPKYSTLLRQLIEEGIATLAGEGFVVEVAGGDSRSAEQAIASLALKEKKIEVRVSEEIDGGCIVRESDGQALYDNSLAGIFDRHKSRLRSLVAEWLWGDEMHWSEV